jgi:UDP-2,4-diacetamido-2,4,6-trideoxy-beta-L-altropyranose hydrolase
MAPHVAFRLDASIEIGAGHFMRCLALADGLRERGHRCTFLCRALPADYARMLAAKGHTLRMLDSLPVPAADDGAPVLAHAHWLGTSQAADAAACTRSAAGMRYDWLVVDHYALDQRWQRALRPLADRILVIDDLADRRHDCDVLLDQNMGRRAGHYTALVPAACQVLAGPQFALLRPDFAALRPGSIQRRTDGTLRQVLVTMGGVDAGNASSAVLEALDHAPLPAQCRVVVVMGAQAPWLAAVRTRAAQAKNPTEVLLNVSNMAELMAASDVAIGAAGTSALERCCLGLPTLTMVLAENQRPGAAAMAAAGAVLPIDCAEGCAAALVDGLAALQDRQAMRAMQQACLGICDGLGIARLVSCMEAAHA